jgi:hypothetical protein
MRKTTVAAALTLAALGLTESGCADEEPEAPEPTPDATTATGAPGGGQVASCLTGDWRSAGVTGGAGGDMASTSVSGGEGVAVTIGSTGQVKADFAGMRPVTFTAQLAGADARGQFTYAGQATGTFRTGGTTPSSTVADTESGTWEPVQPVDWSDVRITLDLSEPTQARVLNNAPFGDYVDEAAERTGNAADTDALLGAGAYECRDDTLVLRPDEDEGGGVTWTLNRQQ